MKKRINDGMTHSLITTLAEVRKARRITQADLAAQAGLSRMAVQRTETGDVDPRFSTLAEMARAHPQSLDELGQVSGVGAKKLEAYGREILRVLETL